MSRVFRSRNLKPNLYVAAVKCIGREPSEDLIIPNAYGASRIWVWRGDNGRELAVLKRSVAYSFESKRYEIEEELHVEDENLEKEIERSVGQ